MTIKLLLLKSGEDLISDIQEMVVGEEETKRVIGYFLDKPCLVKMLNPIQPTQKDDEIQKTSFKVSLYPWMPLTQDKKIPVPSDWVVTIVEPIEKLKNMYIEDVVNYGKNNQDISIDERSSSDNSD